MELHSEEDFDEHQLKLMKRQIEYFKEGKLELDGLINDLLFLRDALKKIDPNLEKLFTEKILDLESVYSYTLEHKMKNLSRDDEQTINEAIGDITEIISTILLPVSHDEKNNN